MQLRSADEGSTVFYEVSLRPHILVGADDSVSNAVISTLKTIKLRHYCCHIYQMYHTYLI
jgi:thiamine pyrophosphokinase